MILGKLSYNRTRIVPSKAAFSLPRFLPMLATLSIFLSCNPSERTHRPTRLRFWTSPDEEIPPTQKNAHKECAPRGQ
ncbi:MAG: hypothetical protein FE78DRAFT_424723 [Acidomyces sp. 'richmondensis']|nr:MAG: hypothetical protein FE78DRAFT_424723 [Acidomyces sp. 'richmondensis']